ncbi:kinase-like protein [Mollisia scopiformis]|uniref:ethanolamine kinase n=1 Tax=Mollisia scopiformis TaxID=149040 RepID=A0A194WUS4_MOLSC|nr:kinase-like protein [Mollisia scopiformis]KUJ11718.1 kinase-like protein [Mollisia scopiformis]
MARSPQETPFLPRTFDENDPNRSVSRIASHLFTNWNPGHGHLEVVPLPSTSHKQLYQLTYRRHIAFDQRTHHETALVKVHKLPLSNSQKQVFNIHKVLALHSLASPLLLTFLNGYAYGFVHGHACSSSIMSKESIWRAIAWEMAHWHVILPVSDAESGREVPDVWSKAREWLDILSAEGEKAKLEKEFEFLIERLRGRNTNKEQFVFGHGNLRPENIVWKGTHDEYSDEYQIDAIKFIDYEHCTYCPVAFELATYFSTWAGSECDYELLPAEKTRRAFIREYVDACALYSNSDSEDEIEVEGQEDAVEKLVQEVDEWRGFVGFYWGLFALLKATDTEVDSAIRHEHAKYSKLKFAEYYAWKEDDVTIAREGGQVHVVERERMGN